MKIRFLLVLFIVITLLTILHIRTGLSVWSSPLQQFNVTPDTIYLNWTNNYNSSLNVTVNSTFGGWLNVTVDNATANTIIPGVLYSLYFNYTSTSYSCPSNPCINIFVQNESGNFVTISKNMTATNTTTFYLSGNISLISSPGRYFGTVRIYNTSNSNENVNVTVILDAPIIINNNTGSGSFSGTLPSNAITYQSFYVDTSSIQNATGIKVNISWSPTQDIDLYLFDNSSTPKLLAKSINKSSTSESLIYSFIPPQGGMWEIRVYGNSTTGGYNGNVYFTTLDSSSRTLDYTVRNVSYSNQLIVTLNNSGGLNISNVSESKELFYVIRSPGNGTRNFSFMVPDSTIAQKIKVSLNWTTSTSAYLLNLYNPNKTLVATSTNKYIYANVSGAEMEEYNETTDIATGNWTLEVKNSTNVTSIDPYNVTIYIKVNEANWITTNYTTSTTGFTFNSSYQPNSNYTINISFTVPNNTMNGLCEGSIKYLDINGAGIKIPIRVNVTTPVLIVNGTWNSSTVTFTENINATFSRALNITISNTGFYNITNITTTNPPSLMYGSNYINFSYQAPTAISSDSSATLNITINLNSSTTGDILGIYRGWIFLNTSNSSYASYPYQGFNLSIEVTLTNLLDVRVTGVNTFDAVYNWIQNATTLPRNVTIQYLNVYYINGTQFKGTSLINYTNISSVRLYHQNASYWSSYLAKSDAIGGFEPASDSGNYQFNVTIPSGLPGGEYEVHVSLNNSNGKLSGESSNKTLFINDTGLYMSSSKSSLSIPNSSSDFFILNISNFGSLSASSTKIAINTSGCPLSSVTVLAGACTGTSPDTSGQPPNVTFDTIAASENRTCNYIKWTFTGSGSGDCTAIIYGTTHKWFNSFSLPITVTATTANVTPTPSPSPGPSPTPTPEPAKYMDITSYDPLIQIAQGNSSSTTVTVKNTNTTKTQDIKLSVENITSTWFSVSPALVTVSPLNSTTFTVTFTIPSTAEIKNYNGVFKAISNYANISKSFTLKVLPSEAQKTTINQTLASYRANMTQLSLEINQSKSRGLNVTLAEAKLLELKVKIEQAEGYANQGDYFNAYQLLSSIQLLIDETKAELVKAKTGEGIWLPFEWQSWMTFVIIGAGAAIAIFLAFLLWPKGKPKGIPTPKILEKPKELMQPREGSAWDQLKEKWAKIKKEKK